jgi:aspartyl protease family protein
MIEKTLKFVLFAALAALMAPVAAPYLGELAAVVADRPDGAVPALGYRAEVKADQPADEAMSSGRTVSLKADGRGHFEAEALVNGRRLQTIVDTGATSVVLRNEDAARLGVYPLPNDYTVAVSTASGIAKAARVVLEEVRIGQVRVRQVDALVMPPKTLSTNLLGMTFMKRLAKVEMKNGQLILKE